MTTTNLKPGYYGNDVETYLITESGRAFVVVSQDDLSHGPVEVDPADFLDGTIALDTLAVTPAEAAEHREAIEAKYGSVGRTDAMYATTNEYMATAADLDYLADRCLPSDDGTMGLACDQADEAAKALASGDEDRVEFVSGVDGRGDRFKAAFFPKTSRGAVCLNGDSVWFDASNEHDLLTQWDEYAANVGE